MDDKTKIKKTLNYIIRLVIIVATYGFIYRQVFFRRDISDILHDVARRSEKEGFWLLLAIILYLMFVNWGLETRKWQILIRKIETIPFIRAFKAVTTGVSVSMFTPNRVGEYFGRVFILEKGNHIQGILITVIGSMSQLLITLVAGLFSLFYFLSIQGFFENELSGGLSYAIAVSLPLFIIILLLLYFRIPHISRVLVKYWKIMAERFRKYAEVFSWYNRVELSGVLLLSLARYLVFSFQFYLMLRIFGIPLPLLDGILLISLIYLGLSVVPTIALVELGVRGSLSIFLINNYFTYTTGSELMMDAQVLAASTLIWLINLVIPALMGTLFVFNLKFFRR